VYIHAPEQPILKKLIDKLAKTMIVESGYSLEKYLMDRNMPEFEFLRHVLNIFI
jgi:hypothetical protein